MYANCGSLERAKEVFYQMLTKDIVSFSAMVMGLAINSEEDEALRLFSVPYVFSVYPKLEHYACYIDILARVGLLEEALEVVKSMPLEPNNFVWGALLGGCLLHSRVDVAQYVSNRLAQVDTENSRGFVMLANTLAFDHRWGDVF
ncbi:hypothetical protein TB2_003167 [Malus domestica]